ncbi:MAG: BREX-3 system phosphatase PglZ, partial [Anaerolineae bacterium]
DQWQAIARRWAQVSLWRYGYDFGVTPAQREQLASLEAALDARFAAWLQANYALLAGMALPRPHHLCHTLGYIEYVNQHTQRVALIVLDGLSLADWTLIRPAWQMRHHEWEISEHLVLAQVPSVTSVSRQALVSGLRPARLADTLVTTQHEGKRWREYWQARTDVAPDRFLYGALDDHADTPLLADILSQRTMAACLVSTAIDNMLHGATQGAADVQASLRLWLADGSRRLEALIDRLLGEGMMVGLASDHGHVEATGMGQPQEGVLVESRSQRARLYTNADFARTVQRQYPETILWSDNALLPAGWHALMPAGRQAFAPQGTRVVSHGGLTIDEMVVPLIHIER